MADKTSGKIISLKKTDTQSKVVTPQAADIASSLVAHKIKTNNNLTCPTKTDNLLKLQNKSQGTQPKIQAKAEQKAQSSKPKLSTKARIALAICGGLPLLLSISNNGFNISEFYGYHKEGAFVVPKDSDYSMNDVSGTEIQRFGVVNPRELYYPTPKMSWLDRLFCRGRHTSEMCDDTPLHPHYESLKIFGIKTPKKDAHKYTTVLE